MLSPSFCDMKLPFFMSSSPLRMASIISGEDMIYSVWNGNGKGVVMISLDEYNSLRETEYIMSSPEMMEAIRKGEEDIKNGNFISQNEGESIDDFLNRVSCTK